MNHLCSKPIYTISANPGWDYFSYAWELETTPVRRYFWKCLTQPPYSGMLRPKEGSELPKVIAHLWQLRAQEPDCLGPAPSTVQTQWVAPSEALASSPVFGNNLSICGAVKMAANSLYFSIWEMLPISPLLKSEMECDSFEQQSPLKCCISVLGPIFKKIVRACLRLMELATSREVWQPWGHHAPRKPSLATWRGCESGGRKSPGQPRPVPPPAPWVILRPRYYEAEISHHLCVLSKFLTHGIVR